MGRNAKKRGIRGREIKGNVDFNVVYCFIFAGTHVVAIERNVNGGDRKRSWR
jgi:hypothetical protein